MEEDILQRAKQKMILDHLVIQRMDTSGRTVTAQGGVLSSNSGAMFDNRELAKILQFGAEDLFAENKEEDEQRERSMAEMDIDEILSRADERTEADGEGGDSKQEDQTEAFLSGFKVASFKSSDKEDDDDEADELKAKKSKEEEGQIEFWQRVIPATMIPAEQLQDDNSDSVPAFLPPRQRRVVQSYNENRLRERAEEERDSDLDEPSDDEGSRGKGGKRRKKRARAGDDDDAADDGELSLKDVRQLCRYMMYFGDDNRVLSELYASAWKHKPQDEQSKRKARGMISHIVEACEAALSNPPPQSDDEPPHAKKGKKGGGEHDDEDEGGEEGKKKARKKLTIELLPGVLLHPAELIQRRKELQNLDQLLAAVADPTKFRVTKTSRPVPLVRWVNCIWKAKQDGMLMYGVFLHGMNAWDAIVDDPTLKLKECITIRRKKQKAEEGKADSKEDDSKQHETVERKEHEQHSETNIPAAAEPPSTAAAINSTTATSSSAPPSAASLSPPARGTASDEYEEIRTVKNGQLASRALALLKAMLLQDDKKKPTGKHKQAASHADDKDRKRGRQQTDEENHKESSREQRKKKPKKDAASRHTAADMDDGPHSTHSIDEQAGAASKKKGGRVEKGAGEDSGASSAMKSSKQSKGALKKADNKRIDEMFSRADKANSDRALKGNVASPPSSHNSALSASPNPHAASSPHKAAKEHKRQNSTSPPSVARKLPPASSSSSSSAAVSGEDDDFSRALLDWCKSQLTSAVKLELKQLHHYAFSDGGFKAHQAEVKVVLLRVGRECERIVRQEKKGEAVRAELERHLWHTVSYFCKMTGPKLLKLYTALQERVVGVGPAATGADGLVRRVVANSTSVGSKTAGGAARPLPRQR